MLIKAEDRRDY